MSDVGIRQAEGFLHAFLGNAILSSESSEFQLRLVFEKRLEFIVSSAWRVISSGELLGGGGDSAGHVKKVLDSIKGLRVTSVSVSHSCDTRLVLEKEYILEVISDSTQYEPWEAHVETGLVVFIGGEVTFISARNKLRREASYETLASRPWGTDVSVFADVLIITFLHSYPVQAQPQQLLMKNRHFTSNRMPFAELEIRIHTAKIEMALWPQR